MSKGNYVVGTREPSGGDKVRGDKGTRQKVSPSGSKEEWRGGIRGQTYESERDVLRGVRRCNRNVLSVTPASPWHSQNTHIRSECTWQVSAWKQWYISIEMTRML